MLLQFGPLADHGVGKTERVIIMTDCERTKKCPYFNEHLKDLKGIQEMWEKKYCRTDKSQCARHMVLEALGSDYVPKLRLPTQIDRANELIAEGKDAANEEASVNPLSSGDWAQRYQGTQILHLMMIEHLFHHYWKLAKIAKSLKASLI